jgi:hypothetical protein
MKIVSNVLEQIGGVQIFPIIALVIFFAFFALLTYLVMTAKKEYIEEMKNMPLEENNDLHPENNYNQENK